MSSILRLLLLMGVCFLFLLFVVGCGLVFSPPTPVVVTREVTREVTRVVVVTATPTHVPVIVERVITVTVLVAVTPAIETAVPEETPPAATIPVATEQVPDKGTATLALVPDTPTATLLPKLQSPAVVDDLDDPIAGLATLSKLAKAMQSQGIHTLRLAMDLSVPIDVTIKNQQQVDGNLTSLVRSQLSNYNIQGNYIIDISVDDLAQQTWVIEALGGVVGLGNEEVAELRQNGDKIWEKPTGGEWSLRRLTPDEALLPLGNSLVTIDAYSHALNLSNLVVDALRPLLLAGGGEPSLDNDYDWEPVTGVPSTGSPFWEMQRERAMSSSNNLKAILASLANSGLSTFVAPAAVTNGIQQIMSVEKAWLIPDTRLVDHSQVEVQGKGVIEVTYLMQQRLLDATVVMKTDNSFEYLLSMTIVTTPEQ
jgi:hypothetical protein